MPVGRTHSVSLLGLRGAIVEIEADISAQLPAFVIIGLPDAALSQAQHRVRSAAVNSGCGFTSHRLTVNLSPASLPKHGSGFDLGIALAALAADGAVSDASIDRVVHLGELGLDGRLRPIAGILPAVLAAARAGFETVMVPSGNADEAALVPGIRVIGVASLRDAAIWHGGQYQPEPVEPWPVPPEDDPDDDTLDLTDVIGNVEAVEAMQVAAAGGHHVLLLGPPGAGKTMLASRLPGLLPDLRPEAALEVSSVRSLAGLPVGRQLATRPPWEAPHHTATPAALIGGGSGQIRPGAAARASHGVLFLDELTNGKCTSFSKEVFSWTVRSSRGGMPGQDGRRGAWSTLRSPGPAPRHLLRGLGRSTCTCGCRSTTRTRRTRSSVSGSI